MASCLTLFLYGPDALALISNRVFDMVGNYVLVAPPPPKEDLELPLKEKVARLKGLILPFFIAFGVLGSIYAGIATPTEAAGVGCVGATVACAINRKLTRETWKSVLTNTVPVSAMLYWVIFGALSVVGIYNLAGGSRFVSG